MLNFLAVEKGKFIDIESGMLVSVYTNPMQAAEEPRPLDGAKYNGRVVLLSSQDAGGKDTRWDAKVVGVMDSP